MRAIGTPPECALRDVANGDFRGMSLPLLVAAASSSQFEEFIWREALICCEVRRFRDPLFHGNHPENKILLLLPGCHADPRTSAAVDWWVNHEDRYTVQLTSPRPAIEKDMIRTWAALLGMCLVFWIVVGWMIWG